MLQPQLMRTLLLILALAGCTSGGAQLNITKSVGAGGGTVNGNDGTSVTIPMGALSSDANITITSVEVAAPTGTVIVGPAYDFGPAGTQFAQPVTITLPFDSAKLPMGRTASEIRIYTAPKGSTEYMQLATTVSGQTVVASASHFTVFVPAAPSGAVAECQPECTVDTTGTSPGCGCTATCGGKVYHMQCFGTTGPSCFCDAGGMTQAASVEFCDLELIQSAFVSQCAPQP
jgi:hypothetical protein